MTFNVEWIIAVCNNNNLNHTQVYYARGDILEALRGLREAESELFKEIDLFLQELNGNIKPFTDHVKTKNHTMLEQVVAGSSGCVASTTVSLCHDGMTDVYFDSNITVDALAQLIEEKMVLDDAGTSGTGN